MVDGINDIFWFLPKFDALDLFGCCISTHVFLIEALGLVGDEDLLPSFGFEDDFAFLFFSRLRFIKVYREGEKNIFKISFHIIVLRKKTT